MMMMMMIIIRSQEESGIMYLYCKTKISDTYVYHVSSNEYVPYFLRLTSEVRSNMVMRGGGWCRTGVWSC
jgi:hypothetical protein